jgi:hypothetical protein
MASVPVLTRSNSDRSPKHGRRHGRAQPDTASLALPSLTKERTRDVHDDDPSLSQDRSLADGELADPPVEPAPMDVVLSYGLGVDSTALLLRWLTEPGSRDFDLSRTDWFVSREDLGIEGHDTSRIQRLAVSMGRSHAQTPSLAHRELADRDYGAHFHRSIAPSRASRIPGIARAISRIVTPPAQERTR